MSRLFLFFILLLSAKAVSARADGPISLVPERTIIISGVIGPAMFAPTMKMLDKLSAREDKTIDIILSSPGGSVIVGSLIIDRIEQLKAEGINIRCTVRDIAASMAFQFLLHCSERYSTPHAFLLWHPVRTFSDGPITADVANALALELKATDNLIIAELKEYMPMKESLLLYHFKQETLHQASSIPGMSPTFFDKVTNNIKNLWPKEAALDTSKFRGFFGNAQLVYIHERFMSREAK